MDHGSSPRRLCTGPLHELPSNLAQLRRQGRRPKASSQHPPIAANGFLQEHTETEAITHRSNDDAGLAQQRVEEG